MTSTPDADARLIAAHDLALAALGEITPAATVGAAHGYLVEEDGSVSLRFENRLPGYPGWFWTVTVARVDDAEPTVLELELLPGDGALLAPEWVPWAERMADYRAQAAIAAEHAATEGANDDDAEDLADSDEGLDDESDDDDLDDAPDLLHAGDLDGVDIDELDDSASDDDDVDDDESDADEIEDSDTSDDSDDEPGSDDDE